MVFQPAAQQAVEFAQEHNRPLRIKGADNFLDFGRDLGVIFGMCLAQIAIDDLQQ